MSVVVRMEMPQNCYECPFSVIDDTGIWCNAITNKVYGYTERDDDCPIICSLPEGHGRLIDADDFIKHIFTEWQNGEISNSEWCDIRQWTNEETTIVPEATEERSET